jgi:hypothetical protein
MFIEHILAVLYMMAYKKLVINILFSISGAFQTE